MPITIDLDAEEVVTLSAAANLPIFPKKLHLATIYRWIQRGIKGVRLESVKIGGTHCTSVEAVRRFIERTNEPDSAAVGHTSARREAEIAAAEAATEAAGV